MTLDTIKNLTLAEVDARLRDGRITRELAEEYIHLWNTTAFRFTEAYIGISGDRILQRNLD